MIIKSFRKQFRSIPMIGHLTLVIVLAISISCTDSEVTEPEQTPPANPTPDTVQTTRPSVETLESNLDIQSQETVVASQTATFFPTDTISAIATEELNPFPKETATKGPMVVATNPPPTEIVRPSFSELPHKYLIGLSTGYLWHPEFELFTEQLPLTLISWSPTGDQIVGYDSKNDTISIFDLETGNLLPLINTNTSFSSWSADGQYLLYKIASSSIELTHNDQIIVYHIESQEIVYSLANLDLKGSVVWSPNALSFAYVAWEETPNATGFTQSLNVVDVLTEQIETYPLHDISLSTISWSPSGNDLLLYANNVSPDDTPLTTYSYRGLYSFNLETRAFSPLIITSPAGIDDPQRFSNGPGIYASITPWSPEGDELIYSIRGDLCIYNIVEGNEICPQSIAQALSDVGAIGILYPAWSPDKEWISFALAFEKGMCDVLGVIRPDGTDLRFSKVSEGDCASFGFSWSPSLSD